MSTGAAELVPIDEIEKCLTDVPISCSNDGAIDIHFKKEGEIYVNAGRFKTDKIVSGLNTVDSDGNHLVDKSGLCIKRNKEGNLFVSSIDEGLGESCSPLGEDTAACDMWIKGTKTSVNKCWKGKKLTFNKIANTDDHGPKSDHNNAGQDRPEKKDKPEAGPKGNNGQAGGGTGNGSQGGGGSQPGHNPDNPDNGGGTPTGESAGGGTPNRGPTTGKPGSPSVPDKPAIGHGVGRGQDVNTGFKNNEERRGPGATGSNGQIGGKEDRQFGQGVPGTTDRRKD